MLREIALSNWLAELGKIIAMSWPIMGPVFVTLFYYNDHNNMF